MDFKQKENGLLVRGQEETVLIEAWGRNALRVRASRRPEFSGQNNALDVLNFDFQDVEVKIAEATAEIRNGALRCEVSSESCLAFYKGDKLLLKEYYRQGYFNGHSPCLKVAAREFREREDGDYRITARFEANEGEKLYGMGQYQQSDFNLKGCVLELAQRNSQISIPFYLSDRGYGFLWNNSGVGEVMFGANYTQWKGNRSEEIDYWITAGDTPKKILEAYTEVTGRAPEFPDNALGLWQCKLRYRTQDELLGVAREYKTRGIPLDVIVIDYYHWVHDGEWSFDEKYWPDPKAMMEELSEMGVRCVVSVWPTVDKRSCNYHEMLQHGFLVKNQEGYIQNGANNSFYDAFNPEARRYIWEKVKDNYLKYGIDMYWLDADEPEYSYYDFEHFTYCAGPAEKINNIYPKLNAMAFYEGLKSEGRNDIVNLSRSAWVGSQKYAALVWSGDVKSNFTALRDQLTAGLHIGIAGIPWWTTDIGGFTKDQAQEVNFTELLVRWYQFAAFCPVLRMHGNRGPSEEIPDTDNPNELWSYGEEAYRIMKKYLDIRLNMKEYIKATMAEASKNGSPVMRPMFYEFPEDARCWELQDQYMFGEKYLVAPVLYQGLTERNVYLPKGSWKSIHDGTVYDGETELTVQTPLDIIPVFEKI